MQRTRDRLVGRQIDVRPEAAGKGSANNSSELSRKKLINVFNLSSVIDLYREPSKTKGEGGRTTHVVPYAVATSPHGIDSLQLGPGG